NGGDLTWEHGRCLNGATGTCQPHGSRDRLRAGKPCRAPSSGSAESTFERFGVERASLRARVAAALADQPDARAARPAVASSLGRPDGGSGPALTVDGAEGLLQPRLGERRLVLQADRELLHPSRLQQLVGRREPALLVA